MEQSNYDHYKVILSGATLPGYSKNAAARKIAKVFNQPFRQAKQLLEGTATVIKQDIPHKKAYQLQQTILSCGAEVTIERIPVAEIETGFSLVPEGEEQTPYKDLAERFAKGERVTCGYCNTQQKIGPYCVECGKQLIGRVATSEPQAKTTEPKLGLIILGLVLLMLGIIHALGVHLELITEHSQWWLSAGSVGGGILMMILGKARKIS